MEEQVQMDRAAAIGAYAAVLWLILWVALDVAAPPSVAPDTLFGLAPLIVCAVRTWRSTALFAAAAVVLVVWSGWWNGAWPGLQQWLGLIEVVLDGTAAVGIAYVRVRRERQLARVTAIAETAQRAILPTFPAGTDDVRLAARYLAAAEDAMVGGDLYDCCLEGYTRILVGDVRGKGIAAVEQAARVTRAFRQAAAAKQYLPDVASSMHLPGTLLRCGGVRHRPARGVCVGQHQADQRRTSARDPDLPRWHGNVRERARRVAPRHRGRLQ
jgi:hypothetical protein